MGYAIAAYVIVIGTLLGYGFRLVRERRALNRRIAAESEPQSETAR